MNKKSNLQLIAICFYIDPLINDIHKRLLVKNPQKTIELNNITFSCKKYIFLFFFYDYRCIRRIPPTSSRPLPTKKFSLCCNNLKSNRYISCIIFYLFPWLWHIKNTIVMTYFPGAIDDVSN